MNCPQRSAEEQSSFAGGLGGVPQILNSPKTGGHRGLKIYPTEVNHEAETR